MSAQDLCKLEYEALRAEERDRMNGRFQIWTLYISLVGAFGFASTQSTDIAYLAAVLPLLLACLARYTRQSEDVLRQIRKYLFLGEQRCRYEGYEHYGRATPRPTHGGHMKALRDAFLLTDALATISILVRLTTDHLSFIVMIAMLLGVIIIEGAIMALTGVWLRR
jgi:hypothetical protein